MKQMTIRKAVTAVTGAEMPMPSPASYKVTYELTQEQMDALRSEITAEITARLQETDALLRELLARQSATTHDAATAQKQILNSREAAALLGVSLQTLHRYTSQRLVPFSKSGRDCRFDRTELERWMMRARRKTQDEVSAEATTYVALNPRQPVRPARASRRAVMTTN